MPLPVCETPSLLLECDIAALVCRWKGRVDAPVSAVHVTDELVIECTIRRRTVLPVVGTLPADVLTECQRDVLRVIDDAPHRLTKPSIIAALATSGRIHGDSTIALALKTLGERGLIDLPRPRSRDGYGSKKVNND